MSAQEALTFLFDALALSFITIVTIDLSREIFALYNQVFNTPKQPPSINSQPQALPQLTEEWLLPQEAVASASTPADQGIREHSLPVLLLAPALAMGEVRSQRVHSAQSSMQLEIALEGLLSGVDLNTVKLRQARKIAKVLGIAQKINGKDQKLDWLRAQIQARLQQETLLLPKVIAVARGELIAC